MVLVQILITPAAGNLTTASGKFQAIPITGKASIRVLSVVYHDTAAATTNRCIQIVSDNLYFPYSPCKYLTVLSNPAASLNLYSAISPLADPLMQVFAEAAICDALRLVFQIRKSFSLPEK